MSLYQPEGPKVALKCSLAKYQITYYSVSYGALKLCHHTELQKVAEWHFQQNTVFVMIMQKSTIHSFSSLLKTEK